MNKPAMTLKCFACGTVLRIDVDNLPQFGFQLADVAKQVGWKYGLDLYRHRVLIFCSNVCREATITKQGTYRIRPKIKMLPK
jgi:hypothetical protein